MKIIFTTIVLATVIISLWIIKGKKLWYFDELTDQGSLATATVKTFLDEFDSVPKPDASGVYKILNFDKELWNPSVREGFLTLWTHQGDTWNENRTGMKVKNIVAYEIQENNFQATTCLRGFWPQKDWQQAGLIVFEDQDNYVRLTAQTHYGKRLKMQVHSASGVFELRDEVLYLADNILPSDEIMEALSSSPQNPKNAEDKPIKQIWLRIICENDNWKLRYSLDGVFYLLTYEITFRFRPRYIGLAAFHGIGHGKTKDCTWNPIPAHFDFLKIEPYP